jgi:hypothetical protein
LTLYDYKDGRWGMRGGVMATDGAAPSKLHGWGDGSRPTIINKKNKRLLPGGNGCKKHPADKDLEPTETGCFTCPFDTCAWNNAGDD